MAYQPFMGYAHRMERRLDLATPVVEKIEQHGKVWSEIIFLTDESLEKRRRVRTIIVDFRSRKAIAAQLRNKSPVDHGNGCGRSGENTYELPSLMRISYAVFS